MVALAIVQRVFNVGRGMAIGLAQTRCIIFYSKCYSISTCTADCFAIGDIDSPILIFFEYISHDQKNGYTALIHAVEGGHTECVRVLLEAGANKNAAGKVCLRLLALFIFCTC